jgi:hypothetical protein
VDIIVLQEVEPEFYTLLKKELWYAIGSVTSLCSQQGEIELLYFGHLQRISFSSGQFNSLQNSFSEDSNTQLFEDCFSDEKIALG